EEPVVDEFVEPEVEPVKDVVGEPVVDEFVEPEVEPVKDVVGEPVVDEFVEPEVEPVKDNVVGKQVKKEFVEETVQDKVEEPVKEEFYPSDDDGKVDLGSDDDYIYVDHSHDDERVLPEEETFDFGSDDDVETEKEFSDENNDAGLNQEDNAPEINNVSYHKSRRASHLKSIISDVVGGETQLKSDEVKTVKGEFIEDDDEPLHKPAPSDDYVVEAEIVNGDGELNALNDDEDYYFDDDEELNIFNDELPDLRGEKDSEDVFDIVDNAKKEYLHDSVFERNEITKPSSKNVQSPKVSETENTAVQDNEISQNNDLENEFQNQNPEYDGEEIQNNEMDDIIDEKVSPGDTSNDGVTYYQGSNDVTSKLRKNNFYYEDEKPRSVKESIQGIKKDMKYINKSLKEIENPTHIDYVSVVDRTEEYNPADYLNMPSDDDSDKIIEREEELTFAEKEELRIEKEMEMGTVQNEINNEDDVIVPVHQKFIKEDLKDQALEDIIQTADEDYKELEKERFRQNNTLKTFDNHKLPGKKSIEDNIINYVESTDIGLNSADDLYKQPINKVSDSIKLIVDIEGPIHVKEVTKRVKDSCHIKRAGSNLKKTVNSAIDNAEKSGDIIKIGDFLYDASNNDVIIRRRNKPNIELISDEEIAKSIELVLTHNQNISTKQIAKETSRNFGFKSTSKKTASRINGVLDLMIANNRVKIENDYVELK
ncbi:DUF3320 domain-containing protein, partial [Methanobrevibacter sp.]